MANHIQTATRYLVEDEEEEDNEFEEEEDDDEEEEEEKSVELELIVESQLKKKRLNLDNKGSVKKGSNSTTSDGGGGGGGGVVQPCCQVEKCGVDLSYAKKYYKRHKVCEVHAKAPIVLVAALRQRFCQQCSRFHELSEFDGTKRSCRRRLAGHNERRRKTTQSPKLEDNQCRQVNGEGTPQITFSSNNSIKNYQIR